MLAATWKKEDPQKVAVVCLSADLVQCIGVFDDCGKAFRRAEKHLREAADDKDGDSVIMPTEDLGDHLNFRRNLETVDGEVEESVYILRVRCDDDGWRRDAPAVPWVRVPTERKGDLSVK